MIVECVMAQTIPGGKSLTAMITREGKATDMHLCMFAEMIFQGSCITAFFTLPASIFFNQLPSVSAAESLIENLQTFSPEYFCDCRLCEFVNFSLQWPLPWIAECLRSLEFLGNIFLQVLHFHSLIKSFSTSIGFCSCCFLSFTFPESVFSYQKFFNFLQFLLVLKV